MSCPSVEALAAAAAGEHARAEAHAADCVECASLLAQQRDLRTLARTLEPPRLSPLRRAKLALAHDPADEIRVLAHKLPVPMLDPERRAELAATTLAAADALPRRRAPWIAFGLVAMAAAAALVMFAARREKLVAVQWPVLHPIASAPSVAKLEPAPAAPPAPIVIAPAPAPASSTSTSTSRSEIAKGAATISGDGDFTRDARDAHDTVELRDGTISIDARDRSPVAVAIGDTTIHVSNAHVEIRAAHGVIVSAHTFAGSVERISPESKAVISAGEVWTPPPPAAALAAFRAGWSALHEGRNADALAAFERASDPVIAEEAGFWAAVAAQRANDREGAAQRFRAFLAAYPQSSRADAARAALQQLP